jgi:hypothetical protein
MNLAVRLLRAPFGHLATCVHGFVQSMPAALSAHPRRVREISMGPARFASAGERRLALLFAGARFGRLVSGASTHRIAAAVTLVGACGVPDSTGRPANGGASDTDLPRLLRLEKPTTRVVPSSDVFCRFTGTASCSAPADWQLRFRIRPRGLALADQHGSIDLHRQDRHLYAR